eukprot:PITA_15992
MVSDFWDQVRNNCKWRIWKDMGYSEESPLKAQIVSLALDLEQRKILVSYLSDQLRWGRNTEGNFNLKEVKRVALGFDYQNLDQIWKNLWWNPHWMKIKLFMWLVQQKKILTWENMLKKGFVGPSKCHLCGLQDEMMEHLLNLYAFTSTLWDWVTSIFRQLDRDRLRIFKRKTGSTYYIIAQMLRQLKDTVVALLWKLPENPSFPQDAHILLQLGLHVLAPQGINKGVSQTTTGKDIWQPPPHGFLKINIDGASKGNPGMARFGGVIRDGQGHIKDIFHSHLGTATNNMAELMALEQCLEILIESNS